MIYVGYGLQKSASSFAWQIAQCIAESAGFMQEPLYARYLPASCDEGFVSFEQFDINEIASRVPADQLMVIKTHSPLLDDSNARRKLLLDGHIKAMATFRDPRDAAVAVYDIAPIERQVGSARSFSRVRSMKDAIDLISDNLWNLQTWLDEPAVLQISFRELSQSPMISCSRIAQHIGIAVDSAKIMAQFQSGARPIKEFNKGTAGRYKFIMNEDDLQYCQESFGDMMDRIARLSNPRAG